MGDHLARYMNTLQFQGKLYVDLVKEVWDALGIDNRCINEKK